jgi:hypothetical protein
MFLYGRNRTKTDMIALSKRSEEQRREYPPPGYRPLEVTTGDFIDTETCSVISPAGIRYARVRPRQLMG